MFLTMILILFQAVAKTPHVNPSATPIEYEPSGFWSIEGILFITIGVIAIPFALGWFFFHGRKTKTDAIHTG